MLRERHYIQRQIGVVTDLALAGAAFFIAHWVRNEIVSAWLLPERVSYVPSWRGYAWLLVFIPPLSVLTLHWNRCYEPGGLRSRAQRSGGRALALAEAAVVAWLFSALFREEGYVSRAQTLLIPAILYILISAKAAWLQPLFESLGGASERSLLLIGSGEPLRQFMGLLESQRHSGMRVVGVVSDAPDEAPNGTAGGEAPSGMSDAPALMRRLQVDDVVFAPSRATLKDLTPLLQQCEEMGIRAHVSLYAFEPVIARPVIDLFSDLPVITYSPVREMGPELAFKWIFDRVSAAALLILLSPVIAGSALAIRLTSKPGDPILFKQTRSGLNGRPFPFWKFRSMRVGAEEERLGLEARNEADGPVFKMRDDPRVTPVGRILRRWSLDELPQLWNVLKGEMSLVGPRPPLPEEVDKYDPWQRRRLSMRPGLTCLWQVSGRSELSFDAWMRLDLHYIDHWSPWLDFKILAMTTWAVLGGRGAM